VRSASDRAVNGGVNTVTLAALRYAIVAAALIAAYYSAIFARASLLFQQDTAASVPAAVELVPYNASYLARLAAWQPDSKEDLLHRALQLNPFDYTSLIQLGLTAEMQQHDLASAESYYLRAADVNHMFLPKWTLANFYFRHEQPEKFFRWAKATLQISPYQADPVFTQMWLISQDAPRIAAALPDKASVLLQYTMFLTHTGQFAPIPPIVERLVTVAGNRNPSDFGRDDQILPEEDRILAAGHLRPALDVWRIMVHAGWIHLPVPTTASPLSNGDFGGVFLGHGFDWMAATPYGLTIEQSAAERNVEVTLSGDEPEHCVLLQQYVPLEPNRIYRLQWQAEGQALESPSGMAWHIRSVQAGTPVALEGGDVLAASRGIWEFQSPSSADVYLLTLEYFRPLGKLRANGSVTLRSVFMQEK